jgi:multimeric flavodoxin WrbA
MDVKVVIINGSPHGQKGGTARIGEWVAAPLRRAGARIVRFDLAALDVHHCNGCGRCMRDGCCPIEDDIARIHEAWKDAGIILLESPTYVFHVSSLMKLFIDRTAGEFHRPSLEGKYAGIITTSAGLGETAVFRYLGNCLEVLGVTVVGSVWGTYRPPMRLWEPERVRERAEKLGDELLLFHREHRTRPFTDEVISQRRFLRELIWRNRKIFKAGYAYWKERGWFHDKADQK